jgi:hypothetical protein
VSPAVFEVHGAKELRRTLKQAGEDLADLKDVNKRVGELVASAARPRVPVRSGALAASIRPAAAAAKVTIRAGSAKLPYAGPVHWGWPAHHITANPFLSDAATRTEETWVGFYFDELQAVVNKVEGA